MPDGKLEQAQEDKLDLVCRKLRLQPGERVLDIGCGWGGFSIWAAQHYGVRAHGVTLSKAQAEWAAARIKREGLEDRCLVEYRDVRDLPADARYDKIAAIGVIEHVGIPNYPSFFGRVKEMLVDGGLYLNHGIHHEFHWKRTSQTDFLYRYVFPNGDLSGVTETLTEMERAGWELLDLENLRPHYARTCRQWAERLKARADEARAIVGEQVYRTWLLYLTCSSVAFATGSIGLYQVLMQKQWDQTRGTAPDHPRGDLRGLVNGSLRSAGPPRVSPRSAPASRRSTEGWRLAARQVCSISSRCSRRCSARSTLIGLPAAAFAASCASDRPATRSSAATAASTAIRAATRGRQRQAERLARVVDPVHRRLVDRPAAGCRARPPSGRPGSRCARPRRPGGPGRRPPSSPPPSARRAAGRSACR